MHQSSLFGSDETPQEKPTPVSRKPVSEEASAASGEPLASRMRPRSLDEIIGQEHLLGPGKLLRRIIESDRIPSIIFWGPPGSGKTTLAESVARLTHARFVTLSAVSAGVADLRRVVDEASKLRQFSKQRTILFVDEIHRFNKAQQDAVLPHVERGVVTLIGATTENPSFEVNSALLSRSRVFVLQELTAEQLVAILRRALEDKERGLETWNVMVEDTVLHQIAVFANGDARTALNILDLAVQGCGELRTSANQAEPVQLTTEMIEDAMQHRALLYDKGGDQHYDMISALHKSVRGSDPDGSLYWLIRMLEAGEDPLYIARRVVRMAAEDIGLADPQALSICVAAQQGVHFVGMPEAGVILAEAVAYLAAAPKSNSVYNAYNQIRAEIIGGQIDPVPMWIRNAPTSLMKNLGYGKDYKYAHNYYQDAEITDPERPPAAKVQEYLPERLQGRHFYEPGRQGKEASIQKWLELRRSSPSDNTHP
ncbi:replication-associated recombination protein A [Dictyobacter arantiisoli]|uniref:Replication-associated recombination protein A n=1 Tax=Dictyobacter arantiisoli TaxID=2014874 RepID=A0A5A5TDJ3_9CHLR|nr:replication-associated recombination protein A [Dictyobacter arantiisoli]GCF09285.1 ATPase AAA [Dictyobacter arantiisoli]